VSLAQIRPIPGKAQFSYPAWQHEATPHWVHKRTPGQRDMLLFGSKPCLTLALALGRAAFRAFPQADSTDSKIM